MAQTIHVKCTQLLTSYPGTVFYALSLGDIHFVLGVSLVEVVYCFV